MVKNSSGNPGDKLVPVRHGMSDAVIGKATLRWQKTEAFLQTNDYIMNADV